MTSLLSQSTARFAPLTAFVSLFLAGCSATDHAPPRAGGSASGAATEVQDLVVRKWEHESSDIPVDPRIHFGHLSNGLRWAWADNARPEERAYLRLHVDVGSLAEQDHEQGMAHFLEHMAFNGSKNFAPGTLIEWFQEHGMAFGADTNAHTSFSETVYKLDLPQADEETLREGLVVMRDYADGLLIEEEEVQNEKGVIDGEQRERDSAGFRLLVQELERMFAGTGLEERLPIGKKPVRDAFTAESVRAFYERWYRPDNMTLVLVGDLRGYDPEALFSEYFADMERPAEPLPTEPELGDAPGLAHFFSLYEEEIPSVSLTVEQLRAWEEEPVDLAHWRERIPLNYARRLVNLRFSELAKEEGAPFLGAGLSSASNLEVFDGESMRIGCVPDKWEEALAFCEQELRRALEYGFQEAELNEVRADALRGLDEAVEREATAGSQGLLARILAAAETPSVPTNAETRRSVVRPVLQALTAEDCHLALREAWSKGELSIRATGNLDLGPDGGKRLAAVWHASGERLVEAADEIVVQDFAYASDPARAGAIAARADVEDFEFESVTFANQVAVNVKRTDFKEKQVFVALNFGEGELSLEPEKNAVNWLAARVFNGAGLEAHSEDDLRRLTAGKTVGVGFSVGPDAFTLSGATTPEDLALQCELACAYLTAPGWRDDGRVQMLRQLPVYFESLEHQHGGPLQREFLPAIFSNDPRQSHPEQAAIEAVTMEDVEGWLAPHLAGAPLEVTIVGDIDVEETLEVAARTFGALPKRRVFGDGGEHAAMPTPQSGVRQVHTIDTQVPKSLVFMVFPLPDGIDAKMRRRGQVLGTVVNDRLRLEVREKLGAAYSPGAGVQMSQVHEGMGMLMIQAMSDPDKVDTLVEACLDVADDLAQNGVTDEEANRLREPILKRRRDSLRTNGYWLAALSEAQRRPESIEELRTADRFYEGYEASDISPLAREHLGRDKASILVVHPEAVATQEAAAPKED